MYDSHIHCPRKYIEMVTDFVNGDNDMELEELEELITEAYHNGEMSSTGCDHLMNLLYE